MSDIFSEIARQQHFRIEALVAALREIAEGKGTFDTDRYVHACNTIKEMKTIARAALDNWKPE